MSEGNNRFSDREIVTGILNGNIQAFALVVKNTEKLVTQIVRKMTTNEDDQKDLVQDIYLKTYQNLSSFRYNSKLSTWIANIAYNTTVNYLQKKKIPITGMETTIENKFVVIENAETGTIQKETMEILHAEIEKLPPLNKTLITLYHIEELSNKEIAEITNLPEGTIKSHLYRTRKILKDNINQHYKDKLL